MRIKITYYCVDCGKILKTRNKKQKRCWDCWKKLVKVQERFCIDCGKPVNKYSKSKRCYSCNSKYLFKIGKRSKPQLQFENILTKEFCIESYIKQKKSGMLISQKVGCSKSTFYKYLRRYNIKIFTNSESHKGYKFSEERKQEYREKFKGEKGANWQGGRIRVKCHVCHKEIDRNRKAALNNKFFICSNECRSKYAQKLYSGKNNPNWLGGMAFDDYPWYFNEKLKHKIRQRDNFICQCCGMTEEEHVEKYGKCLTIHHIDYNKKNCEKKNLITVCIGCNTKANYNRDYWYAYYKYIIDNKLYKEKI